jgi:hypothetical protein
MLKNFSFFSVVVLLQQYGWGFENMPGMKLFFFACENEFFCSPMHTVCEILFVPVLEILRELGQHGLLFLVAKRICSDGFEIVAGICFFFSWRVLLLVALMLGRSKVRHVSKMSKVNEKFSAKLAFLVAIDSLFILFFSKSRGKRG